MKKFTIICYFLSLFIPSVVTAVHEDDGCKVHKSSCLDWKNNCEDVNCTRGKHLETTDKQHDILASLYGIPKTAAEEKIRHNYNYYGESCNLRISENNTKCVYKGGHAGWDVRTLSYDGEEFPEMKNHEFHCITPGIVLANGRDDNGRLPECENNNRTIVIYDDINGYATHYLHASNVNFSLQIGKPVIFGETLGWEGTCGLSQREHIHIEVRTLNRCISYENLTPEMKNELVQSSHGTKDTVRPTIDPIPYLYDIVKDNGFKNNHVKACTLPEIWGRCKMMH